MNFKLKLTNEPPEVSGGCKRSHFFRKTLLYNISTPHVRQAATVEDTDRKMTKFRKFFKVSLTLHNLAKNECTKTFHPLLVSADSALSNHMKTFKIHQWEKV